MRFSSFRQLPVDAAEFWQVHGDARPSGRAFFRKDAGFPSTIIGILKVPFRPLFQSKTAVKR